MGVKGFILPVAMLLILSCASATTTLYDYANTPGSITAYHGGHINLPLPVDPADWCVWDFDAPAAAEDTIFFREVPKLPYIVFNGEDYAAIASDDDSRTETSGYCGDGQVNVEDYFFSISESSITDIAIFWDGYASDPVALYVYNFATLAWEEKDSAKICGPVAAASRIEGDVIYFGAMSDCQLTANVSSSYLTAGQLRFAIVETNALDPQSIHTDYVSVTVTSQAPAEGGATPTCAQYRGEICGADEVCKGTYITASDTSRCCNNYCEKINRPLGEACGNNSQCASGKCVGGGICGDCYNSNECTADQSCGDGTCKAIGCDCGEIVNHVCEEYECCSDSQCGDGVCDVPNNKCVGCLKDGDCEGSEFCEGKECGPVDCGCGEITNHKCLPFQCCSDTDCAGILVCQLTSHKCVECNRTIQCPDDRTCSADNICVDIPCECGEAAGHECVEYECCSDDQCSAGEICDITDNVCVSNTPPGGMFTMTGNWVYSFLGWLFGLFGFI